MILTGQTEGRRKAHGILDDRAGFGRNRQKTKLITSYRKVWRAMVAYNLKGTQHKDTTISPFLSLKGILHTVTNDENVNKNHYVISSW